VTGARSALVRDLNRRAEGDASLIVALATALLVPFPALLAGAGASAAHVGVSGAIALLAVLAAATPVFAVAPFVLGCGIGTLLHLVVTAPARFAAIRADRGAPIGARSLVAMSLLVGEAFAAFGLMAAIVFFRVG
jgi:hypothetical protein